MSEPRYTAPPPDMLHMAQLGALTALFDRRSAQTHVMASPMPEILAAMGDGDWSAAELTAHLGRTFDLEGDDPAASIADRLTELEAMGLVLKR